MQRDDALLHDVLESARLAVSYVEGRTLPEFLDDIQLQDAVIRRLEVIGEAANQLTDQSASELSDIPWREMVGMRNVLIHQYGEVDPSVVWETVQRDLPPLIALLRRVRI